MREVVLSKINLIYGFIDSPKGFKINRTKIKEDIIQSFFKKDNVPSYNPQYNKNNFIIDQSQPLIWLQDYLRDHINCEFGFTLIPKISYGTVLATNEQTILKNNVDPVDLRNSSDFTLLYGVDLKQPVEVVIEYDDNRRKGRTWNIFLEDNKFLLFPSTQKYFIKKNESDSMNIFLTINYEYI